MAGRSVSKFEAEHGIGGFSPERARSADQYEIDGLAVGKRAEIP